MQEQCVKDHFPEETEQGTKNRYTPFGYVQKIPHE